MSTVVGAKIEDLEKASLAVAAVADRLAGVTTTVNNSLENTAWKGPAATDFRTSWADEGSGQVKQAAAEIRQLAERLRQEATQQTNASKRGAGTAPNVSRQFAPLLAVKTPKTTLIRDERYGRSTSPSTPQFGKLLKAGKPADPKSSSTNKWTPAIGEKNAEDYVRARERSGKPVDFQHANYLRAGADPKKLAHGTPSERLAELEKIYDFYGRMFTKTPEVLWAGLAKYAGAQVYANLDLFVKVLNNELTIDVLALGLGLPGEVLVDFSVDKIKICVDELINGAQLIFEDMGSQVTAYQMRGANGVADWVRRDYKDKRDETSLLKAWNLIGSSKPIDAQKGLQIMTAQEQGNHTVQPVFDRLRNRLGVASVPTELIMSNLAASPFTGGKSYADFAHPTYSIDGECTWPSVKPVSWLPDIPLTPFPVCYPTVDADNSYMSLKPRMAWLNAVVFPGWIAAVKNNPDGTQADMNMSIKTLAKRYDPIKAVVG